MRARSDMTDSFIIGSQSEVRRLLAIAKRHLKCIERSRSSKDL